MEKANPQTQIIERDLSKLSDRFDRHLEIYAQNSKELYGLKSAVESLRTSIDRQESRGHLDLDALRVQTKENTTDISDIKIVIGKLVVRVSIIVSVAATVASIVGSLIASSLLT